MISLYNTPPRHTADDAAHELAAEGKHVHLVSEGESICISGECER